MSLYQICYRSRIKPDVVAGDIEDEIAHTINRLRRMNALNGVTGALILTDTHVFQLIEGQAEQVDVSLQCAASDPRHERVEILSRKAVEYRLFHDSWLYFADLRMDHGRELPSELSMIMPRPETANAADILALMAHIAGDLAEAQLTNRLLQI
ncbi:FAD-dependent sensor of blue light [Breoghania corrubedonensis]|uniref:FAD-dependent sensor of blue light n=1 Tax=Breoghania corrubedonensis TaxID=665038 RepID=A0A2T5V1E8_9HYPH|nr:BLUF domain-containing protein [Breoghania corrubedonensis]PTW57548.1 FAD-dependent sensor of blue light [Breoghania corrubedonensis]